ncbi:MAG TPA: AAA family ATPase [Candidatus Saccharimonadales bacterium]
MDISIAINRQYKSFKNPLTTSDLNNFVVLTGMNGTGKSQLLQIIERRSYIDRYNPPATAAVTIGGEAVDQADILGIFNWDMPPAPAGGMSEVQSYSQQIHSTVVNIWGNAEIPENIYSRGQAEELRRIAQELQQAGYDQNTNQPSIDTVIGMLSANFANKSAQIINERLATIIYRWHFRSVMDHKSFNRESNPIRIFNRLCKEFETGYKLPHLTDPETTYFPQLVNPTGDKVNWNELSSGEQVIFRIICWLFYYHVDKNLYPKLLLLDEPDAHLTPKMIHKLIINLQSVLVDKMGIAVIMTTHSPNTVALCNEQALYELKVSRSVHRIEKITQREALTTFSEGLLFVQEDTRLVFVEGKDDIPFYTKLYQAAFARHELETIPSLKFIAASNARPDHGGCTQVLAMVPRFAGSSIENLVHGLIDNDNSNSPQQNIAVLDRYSIESYLYDPLIIATNLLIHDKHRGVISCLDHLSVGEYEKLLSDAELLQTAVDEVVATLKANNSEVITNSGFSSRPIDVKWLVKNKKQFATYTLPEWFIKLKKADLTTKVIHSNASPFKHIQPRDQYLALETIGAVPEDIYEKFQRIQG